MKRDSIVAAVDAAIDSAGGAGAVVKRLLPDGVVLVNAANLKPERVSWLWQDWLARGKLHILAGAPGQGKTTIALALAATISSGGRWPDGSHCTAANVLVWSGEDDPADTLLPRLLAMGGDPRRIHFITGTRENGEVCPFDPARDLVQLSAAAEHIRNVELMIVDPVVSAVAGDGNKNGDVRKALQPLVDLAAALRAAVLGITHFSKGTAGRDPTERVTGSVAFGAVARVVMVAAKIKKAEGDRRVFARSKSNIGPDDGGFEYAIAQTEVPDHAGFIAATIQWGASLPGTARELLAEAETPETEDDDESSALGEAITFLQAELADGPRPSRYIFAQAKDAGHSERTLKRAKKEMGIEAQKVSGKWVFAQPKGAKGANSAEGAKAGQAGPLENLGTLGTLESVGDDDCPF